MEEKQIIDDVEGKEPWSWRKARESRVHREVHKENTFSKPLARNMKGADFGEFFQPVRIKDWILEICRLT